MTVDPLDTIPGWFAPLDRLLFRWFLNEQRRMEMAGDLAELGVYMGKSAVVVGEYLNEGETFTVIDLFEGEAGDVANQAENDVQYGDLSQAGFEGHYRRFHVRLPVVVRGQSQAIVEHASHGSHRFIHIDASHLYEHVRGDLAASRVLAGPGGLVVLDDFRESHTPGVACAGWESVVNDGLVPLLISYEKLYGTWGDPATWQERIRQWLGAEELEWEEQVVAGHPLVRIKTDIRSELSHPHLRSWAPPAAWALARTANDWVRSYRNHRGR